MAKVVRKIEAAAPAPVKLKRVAAYARVSMETERLGYFMEHTIVGRIMLTFTLLICADFDGFEIVTEGFRRAF